MIRFLRGSLELELSGAALERCLNRWSQAQVSFWNYRQQEALRASCRIYLDDLEAARREAARAQAELRVLARRGLPELLRRMRQRPVLVVGTLLSVALALFLQSFVWFCQVQGLESVSEAEILHALQEEGVKFGSVGMDIDSEDLKNRILNRIPELRWLAVNREGGLVTVLAAERKLETPSEDRSGIANVVAVRPGIIRQIDVTEGLAMVAPGDSVQEGTLLISGIAEWTTHIQMMRASGEVYAETARQMELLCPAQRLQKRYTGRVEVCRSIIFQRKREKISGNSSIFGSKCDRMIETSAWILPGGYELPIVLETERLMEYELVPVELDPNEAAELLRAEASRLLQAQLVAGTVKLSSTQIIPKQDSFRLRGTYNCLELISKTVPVELFGEEEQDGKNH